MHSPMPARVIGRVEVIENIPEPRPLTKRSLETYAANAASVINHSKGARIDGLQATSRGVLLDAVWDLIAREDQLKAATAQAYRSAMLWQLQIAQDQSHEAREAYSALRAWKPWQRRQKTRRTRTGVPQGDLAMLVTHLISQSARKRWAHRTQLWVVANYLCGARPVESLNMQVSQEGVHVRTAKVKLMKLDVQTAQRSTHRRDANSFEGRFEPHLELGEEGGILRVIGPCRKVPFLLESAPEAIRSHLESLSDYLQESGASTAEARMQVYKRYYNNVRQTLRRACLALWTGKKNYTLTSMRKQFQANARAITGGDLQQVRAWMGHASSGSSCHYGTARTAHSHYKKSRPAVTCAHRSYGPAVRCPTVRQRRQ